jgi:hypothetical protein
MTLLTHRQTRPSRWELSGLRHNTGVGLQIHTLWDQSAKRWRTLRRSARVLVRPQSSLPVLDYKA